MADMPGGKPRLSNADPLPVSIGRTYSIGLAGENCGQATDLALDPALSEEVVREAELFTIGDGENQFEVKKVENGIVWGHFTHVGTLERQRAFLPVGIDCRIEVLTEKDRASLRVAQRGGFDLVALSFVESARDIAQAREWLRSELSWTPGIVAKIETRRGVGAVEEIAREADLVMVGRGDLAFQCTLGLLWHAQRRIIEVCRRLDKYVIVATEFLESLERRSLPTRPEIMDICSALEMGANALMLTVETAIGPRPIEAVALLREIERSWRAGLVTRNR
jgi:pyruvate kinase